LYITLLCESTEEEVFHLRKEGGRKEN